MSSADCDAADEAGWTVAMVVAHVATNDRLIAAHLRRAMAGEPTAYDNRPCTAPPSCSRSSTPTRTCAR